HSYSNKVILDLNSSLDASILSGLIVFNSSSVLVRSAFRFERSRGLIGCDLVITANGKTEKIASGLLNPFLAHLSTAQDQIAKGGYSITLELDPRNDISWFTKGTVERFVRFVSTPEVLERVNTIESEILQIDEAIANQSIDNHGLNAVEDHQLRSMESMEGRKPSVDTNGDKAIVLFKPGVPAPESDGSTAQGGNSKAQLLRVLETRRTVLQKEQGMAFARAVAAGFDMDQMAQLISFAECFGAKRLREACLRYMDLWKQKHETGQWLEIEAADAMSSRSDFAPINASGIVLSDDIMKQKELAWPESLGELGSEGNEKSNDVNTDQRSVIDSQVPGGPREYFQGNYQHPMYPQWPMHSPSGVPLFQPYPMQGMPYYQNFPGNGPYFQPPYPPVEDPRLNVVQRTVHKKHSVDSKDSNTESENGEMGAGTTKLQDADQNISEEEGEDLRIRVPLKKVGKSGKKKAGMVVIRNINYITKAKHNSSGSESQSASESDTGEDSNDSDAPKRNRKNHHRSSKSKGRGTKLTNARNPDDGDDVVHGQDTDGGNWQAFQNFLLRDNEEKPDFGDSGMFSAEKEVTPNRKQSRTDEDPILHPERDLTAFPERGISEFDTMNGKIAMLNKQRAYNDESAISHEGFRPDGGSRDVQLDMQFKEMENGGTKYRGVSDDFMVYQQGSKSGKISSILDPVAENESWNAENLHKSSNNVTDESFIVPLWSNSQDQVGTGRGTAIDMDSEFSLSLQKTEDSSKRVTSQLSYEPDDLSLMPERGTERESVGYDPAMDYEMQFHSEGNIMLESGSHEDVMVVKEVPKKLEKDKKSRVQDASDKRKVETAMRKGRPTKSNPLVEAKERAERLRAFKADIQKIKKEKEEEAIKRIETLKLERQKRIAARGGSVTAQSPATSQQARSRLPPKLSPGSNKGSKSSESELASSSPTQKLASAGLSGSQKTTGPGSRLNVAQSSANGLTRSLSSLTDIKEANDGYGPKDPETKAAAVPARRLSDPKGGSSLQVTLKSGGVDRVPKPKASNEPETKRISAASGLDRSRSATVPEMKPRTSRGSSDDSKSTAKEAMKKSNSSKSSIASKSIETRKNNVKTSDQLEDNAVIEKTVVMLEHEMPTIPIVQASEAKTNGEPDGNNTEEKTDVILEYTANHALPSPITTGEVEKGPSHVQLDDKPKTHEVKVDHYQSEISKASDVNVSEDLYHGDGQNSLMEDPHTDNSEFSKTSPINSKMMTSTDTGNMHLSVDMDLNLRGENVKEVEKHHGSSKGFKRFLKLGRKSNSSATNELIIGSDNLSIDNAAGDDHIAMASSSTEGKFSVGLNQ
ncbi:hypothetical protein ACLOJK_009674, partial [Asimina triloba]